MASASITRRRTRSGPRYVVRYRLGGRAFPIRHAGSFTRERDAKARLGFVAGELAVGRDPAKALAALLQPAEPVKVETLDNRFGAFIESRVDVGSKTIALYRNARAKLGKLKAADPAVLTPADFQAWVAENAGLSPRTLAHYLSTIRQVLDFCDVTPNPARSPKVKLPSDDTAEVEAPNTKEWQAIKRHAPRRVLLALRLIEATGLRVSEAADLTFGDVDFAEERIRVSRARTKRRTAGQRWLPVPVELLEEIEALCPFEDRTRERAVFAGVNAREIRGGLDLACRNAKIAHYSPHDLRHRRTSLWLAHGFDPITVKEWCGHSRASMTLDVYAHVVTDPEGDEWRDFWLTAFDRQRLPKAARRSPGVVPVWSESEVAD
jgi:integrase